MNEPEVGLQELKELLLEVQTLVKTDPTPTIDYPILDTRVERKQTIPR